MKPRPFFTIVDRYFMRKFLFVSFAILFVATSIFVIFDVLSSIEDVSALFEKEHGGAAITLLQYYTVRMLNILHYTGVAFLAVITAITFFLLEKNSSMNVRGGEVIPLLTSGISRCRVAVPFFIIGIFTVFFMCALEELFFIYCRDWPGATSSSCIEKVSLQDFDLKNDPATGLKIYGRNLNTKEGTFENAKIGIPPMRTLNQTDEILLARRAVWLAECDEHPSGYMLESVSGLKQKAWLALAAHQAVSLPILGVELPVFYTSETAPWVKPEDVFFIASLAPEKLCSQKLGFLPQSLPALYRDANDVLMTDTEESRTGLHIRILRPFSDSLLLFLLIPVILSARMRSKIAIFFCLLIITGTCFGMVELGKALAVEESVSPTLGAWLPFLILIPAAALLREELNT